MRQVEEMVKWCDHCKRPTVHVRNRTRINWGLHFFLTLMTAGFWLIVVLLLILASPLFAPLGGWTCTRCGG